VQLLLLRRRVDDLTTWTGILALVLLPLPSPLQISAASLPAKPPGAAAPAGRCCCSRC
jgi:hypothetical protein